MGAIIATFFKGRGVHLVMRAVREALAAGGGPVDEPAEREREQP